MTHRLLLLRHGELDALFAEGRHGGVVDLGRGGRPSRRVARLQSRLSSGVIAVPHLRPEDVKPAPENTGGRFPLVLPAYVGESRWLMAWAITSFRSAASVIPSKPNPK